MRSYLAGLLVAAVAIPPVAAAAPDRDPTGPRRHIARPAMSPRYIEGRRQCPQQLYPLPTTPRTPVS